MAVGRTQIRLGALTGSLDDTGLEIAAGALDADSLQASLDALAAAQKRQLGTAQDFYTVGQDVISIASQAKVSGSLTLVNGSDVDKLYLNVGAGAVSGSDLVLGALGAAGQSIRALHNSDLDIGFGLSGVAGNRFINLDAGSVGSSGGVKATLSDDAGASKFVWQNKSLASKAELDSNGNLQIAGAIDVDSGNIRDASSHNRIQIPDAGSMVLKDMAGSATLATFADALTTLVQPISASATAYIAGAAGETSLRVDDGDVVFDVDLSVGQDARITRDLTVSRNATITGDLTVNGTTTTIDTEQLSVQDSVIAMGMSGSGIPGPAGDRGIFMSLRGEDDPALVWSEANDKFALVRTATSPSASMGTIALTSDADLSVKSLYASVDADLQGDLIVRGGNVNLSNAVTQVDLAGNVAALKYDRSGTLLAEWDANGAATYGLRFRDDMNLWFGGDSDAHIFYANGSDDLIMSASGTTDIKIGVDAGDDIKFRVAGQDVMGLGGSIIKVEQPVVGPTGAVLLLSSSAGRDTNLSSTGGEIRLSDGLILGSTWSLDHIKLSAATSEWNDFETNFGEVSLLSAIVQAKGSALGASKNQFPLTSDVAAGTDLSSGTGAETIDMTGTTPAGRQAGVNVFVNGQLMHSGTEANRAAGTADYNLRDGTITAVDMRFAFAIQADDVVSVVVS